MAKAARDLELRDCCSIRYLSTDHFTMAGASFRNCSRITVSLRRYVERAWFGGVGPGLLATTLSGLAFDHYFLSPIYSLAAKCGEVPRLIIFTVSALFVGLLSAAQRSATESLRRARDDLRGTVQEVQRSNEALRIESLERRQAEEALREAQADLARVSRVTTMGELTASLAHEVNQPIAAARTNANTCLRWLAGDTPNIEEARAAAMRIVKDQTRAEEIISRIRLLFYKGTPQRELVNVNEVIREMIVLLRRDHAIQHISRDGPCGGSSPGHGRPLCNCSRC